VASSAPRTNLTLGLPDIQDVVAVLPRDLADDEDELLARVRLAFLNSHVTANIDDLESAIDILRARAAGNPTANPFAPRIKASSYEALADAGQRALDAGRLTLGTVLALQYESGCIAAKQGRRLILFLGLTAEIRRALWEFGMVQIQRQDLGHEGYVELGRWLALTTEMTSLAVGEGYRATERELLAHDVAARRAAIDELLGAVPAEGQAASRLRRLAMRYGLDPDATYRVAAILPGPDADPTPEQPGIDDADLEIMARRIDKLLRRPGRHDDGAGTGIRVPLALTWRGAIVAILGPDPREWQRLQDAVVKVFGSSAPSWIAIATGADGVTALARSLAELREGLRVADGIDRRGVIDDLSELGIERLLLSDPDLAAVIVERELGPLLADARMGDELIETLQVFFDAAENRRETARRLHLADRTIAYRLERAEALLGHGFEGEAGRRLNVALTLRRLEGRGSPR
jgi:hypothetical protein